MSHLENDMDATSVNVVFKSLTVAMHLTHFHSRQKQRATNQHKGSSPVTPTASQLMYDQHASALARSEAESLQMLSVTIQACMFGWATAVVTGSHALWLPHTRPFRGNMPLSPLPHSIVSPLGWDHRPVELNKH